MTDIPISLVEIDKYAHTFFEMTSVPMIPLFLSSRAALVPSQSPSQTPVSEFTALGLAAVNMPWALPVMLAVGMAFETRQELKDTCDCYAIEKDFEFRTLRYYSGVQQRPSS